ncbi:MAG: hypothetical protein COV48_09395 [Elusimicrobia bacterium CG11_big_fil_rev_8_21_14_0_20_64_6]|nr:MAG: hypothetical protein COV48_09395 [Elusimicrobia bacterium CG11_big_fil_rev_8_21_14_0_20_64_6]
MNSRFLTLALIPLGLLLSACAVATPVRSVGGGATGSATAVMAPRVPLKACLVRKRKSGRAEQFHFDSLSPAFTQLTELKDNCDILIAQDYNPHVYEFSDMADGRPLFTLTYSDLRWGKDQRNALMVADIKERLSPSGELFKSIKLHSAPPAVAAASSGGLSAADIERIAKAVQGAAPAAPASAASYPPSPSPRFNAADRPHDLAIIIGIESYSDIASKASYAERDADAFKAHVRALGVPERNIVLLKGSKAGKASLEKNIEAWLPRMVKADSRVYFYFSGHGAPDVKTGQAYLVPWDGDPNFLESTAYPVAKLYKKLGALPAKQVLVAMDSCFSGAGGRSVLASGARPLVGRIEIGIVPPTVTVLAASGSNEISGSLDEKGHGAFTYFLLEGLNAGKTTPKALNDYLTPRVQDEARRLNRDQTPQLQGGGGWSLR